jgi:hypothetical protein
LGDQGSLTATNSEIQGHCSADIVAKVEALINGVLAIHFVI